VLFFSFFCLVSKRDFTFNLLLSKIMRPAFTFRPYTLGWLREGVFHYLKCMQNMLESQSCSQFVCIPHYVTHFHIDHHSYWPLPADFTKPHRNQRNKTRSIGLACMRTCEETIFPWWDSVGISGEEIGWYCVICFLAWKHFGKSLIHRLHTCYDHMQESFEIIRQETGLDCHPRHQSFGHLTI